jgi:hypothetical protein
LRGAPSATDDEPPVAKYFGVIDAERQRAMRGIEFARHDDVLDFEY